MRARLVSRVAACSNETLKRALVGPSLYDEVLRLLSRRGYGVPEDYLSRDFSLPYVASKQVAGAWLGVYHNAEKDWDLYELAERLVDLGSVAGDGPLVTLEWGHVELNADQVDLLRVICGPRLDRPADQWADIPTNRAAAAELGWSLAKYNRKLDHVCDKLARVGVRGLRGDLGLSAMDRRRTLVDHVVRSGLLGALAVPDDDPEVPQQSSAGRAS